MNDANHSARAEHWESVWVNNAPETTSWFENSPSRSLELIESYAAPSKSVIDIGGGGSSLAHHLSRDGFRDLTVLDISDAALAVNRAQFGEHVHDCNWIVADIIEWSPERTYDVWHDRAVFHFLVTEAHALRYAETCAATVAPGGFLVIGAFGPNGPETCSGLPVQRRSIAALSACFESNFVVIDGSESTHVTPHGTTQEFVFIVARRVATDS